MTEQYTIEIDGITIDVPKLTNAIGKETPLDRDLMFDHIMSEYARIIQWQREVGIRGY